MIGFIFRIPFALHNREKGIVHLMQRSGISRISYS
jgi:hypothetical protein